MDIENVDMKLEVVVLPVADVNRSIEFYGQLGWRRDVTPPVVVQYTPHGSSCSIQFGATLTTAAPGSARNYLVVADIVAARDAIVAAGVQVSDFVHLTPDGPVPGLDPDRGSYRSRATFSDTDGNTWILQEVTARLPGRLDPGPTSFASASDLAGAFRRAAAAHGEHEARTGQADADWPDWYAAYMVAEQAGAALPE
jgi:catechol 2,3-dioxygenase-like lactoylglutathione lyase family enzyme